MDGKDCRELLTLSQLLAGAGSSVQSTLREFHRTLLQLFPTMGGYTMLTGTDPAPPVIVSFGGAAALSCHAHDDFLRMIRGEPSDRAFVVESAPGFVFAVIESNGVRLGGILAGFDSVEQATRSLERFWPIVAVSAVHIANALRCGAAEERVRYVLEHDEVVTRLPNRLLFRQHVVRAIEEGSSPSILFLDLDGFNTVNRDFGYTVGDSVLSEVARRWQQAIASEYQSAMLARMGGDEFGLFLPEGILEAPGSVVRLLLNVFREPFAAADASCRLNASIGISCYPRDGRNIDDLLRSAEKAMFIAKSAGGGAFAFADSGYE